MAVTRPRCHGKVCPQAIKSFMPMARWLTNAVPCLCPPVMRDSRVQVVTERLLCHAIIGNKAGKAQIMQVDVTCEFVAPVLQFSSREITFRVEKVSLWIAPWCLAVQLMAECHLLSPSTHTPRRR